MNDRIKKLREQSLRAVNKLSEERAILVTDFYKSYESREISIPMKRALCFKHIMENKY